MATVATENRVMNAWLVDWLRGFRGSSPRYYFAHQLRRVRATYGNAAAQEFARSVRRVAEVPNVARPIDGFDASYAWDLGYGYAVRGILHPPGNTWVDRYLADWRDGYEQAKRDGKWGSWNGN